MLSRVIIQRFSLKGHRVGSVYQNFERELAVWDERYADAPKEHMLALCLLTLEREEIVSVGYRESLMLKRLAAMRIPDEVRDIIRHALVWAWKDEEMHAIYIRGAMFKLGSLPLRIRAFNRQVAGAIGGWAASVQQHVRWQDAPLSRSIATLTTRLGVAFGKVPEDVRAHLAYGPFRRFCLFNVDAEQTAWLCWHRMAEIASKVQLLPPNAVDDFRRVEADEMRHAQVFQILADSLTEEDTLVPGVSADMLVDKIAAVSEFFVPRNRRTRAAHPLGSGGAVHVMTGERLEDKLPLFWKLLEQCGIADAVRAQAHANGKKVAELNVAIKPTFMLGYDRRDTSMITDPVLVEALAQFLRSLGCGDVAVIEARNLYDQFYEHRSVREVAEYFGFHSPHYRLVDGSDEQVPHAYFRGMAQYTVARTWKQADFRISFGKMRSHPVELVYLTVGNVEWMGGRCDEFIFAERQAQRETAIMMLLDEFPPHFALLDAYESAADGLVGVMGCPSPKRPLRFYAGSDSLAVDVVAARHMHMRDTRQSSILAAAYHWFGGGDNIGVIGCDEPLRDWRHPYHNEISTMLSLLAFPVYVLGSGRGSMFLPAMDTSAFPRLRRETPTEWLGRRAMRLLLGLRRPG
jgi:uncharacterized protein (DUF362 family)